MSTRIGKIKFFELIRHWFVNSFGSIYFLTPNGKKYLNRLVEMSDTSVLDGKINTVVCGDEHQRLRLVREGRRNLTRIFISTYSVMSCYVGG